jgi:hypothetical protein
MEMATPPLEARNDNFNKRLYTFLLRPLLSR